MSANRSRGIKAKRDQRINLGIAISGATLEPGKVRTLPEIAAYAGISKQAVAVIERRALRKVRARLRKLGIAP